MVRIKQHVFFSAIHSLDKSLPSAPNKMMMRCFNDFFHRLRRGFSHLVTLIPSLNILPNRSEFINDMLRRHAWRSFAIDTLDDNTALEIFCTFFLLLLAYRDARAVARDSFWLRGAKSIRLEKQLLSCQKLR